MTLEYAVGASAIAQGWAGYFVNFMQILNPGLWIPPQLFNYPLYWGLTCRYTASNLSLIFLSSPLALGIIVICSGISFVGIKGSSRLNQIMSILNVTLITAVIIIGALKFDKNNWDNYFGPGMPWKGLPGMLTGEAVLANIKHIQVLQPYFSHLLDLIR